MSLAASLPLSGALGSWACSGAPARSWGGGRPFTQWTGRRAGCRGLEEMAVTLLLSSPLQEASWRVCEEKCGCLLRVLVSLRPSLLGAREGGMTVIWIFSGQGSKYFLRGALQVATCVRKCGCGHPVRSSSSTETLSGSRGGEPVTTRVQQNGPRVQLACLLWPSSPSSHYRGSQCLQLG